MIDTMLIALEAAWELDPVRIENKLWDAVDRKDSLCYALLGKQQSVEKVSNENCKSLENRGLWEL